MDYIENHDLRVDESGSAGAHVTVRIQDTDLETARRFVRSILGVAETFSWEGDECTLPETHYEPGGGAIEREIVILRPQVDGPCIHYGPDGCEVPGGVCPHLDNPDVLCPVKDACYAMHEVARKTPPELQEVAEQDEQDADMAAREPVYETAAPEWVEPEPDDGALHTYTVPVHEEEPPQDGAPPYAIRLPPPAKRKNAWTEEENWTVARVDGRGDVIKIYRAAFPDSARTDKAIVSRWEKLHRDCREPLTLDTVGDTALVTQCDEDPVFTVPHPTYRPGDRVRIKHALHRGQTGKIERYFPATDNYLVAIDGMPDMIVLTDAQMEAV